MRLDRVYIDGFKNLNDCSVDFDENRLTTVIIGRNGAGKSNLIEAIVDVFRFVDFNRARPRYRYEIEYRTGNKNDRVILSNLSGKPLIKFNNKRISRKEFDQNRESYFPDLIFGYYSGGSRRLESLFDSHQRRYYDVIKINDNLDECQEALNHRRFFYCRPIHGDLALMSFFAFPQKNVEKILKDKIGVTSFHSSLTVFRQPWFSTLGKASAVKEAPNLWGAKGPAGMCSRAMKDLAFHPIALTDNPIDDYRGKSSAEVQYGVFFRDKKTLKDLTKKYTTDQELFYALESMDISDLIRELHLWVNRVNDSSGNVSFSDLSDGERQLLMVLGLIRVSRGKRALFLLDEPDTHLNPHWQHTYLQLIQEWTDVAADDDSCHIIMTSHNPLTISSFDREEVRVMTQEDSG
ncbi:MAG: AAA family ATPase [Ekhidna sp.]